MCATGVSIPNSSLVINALQYFLCVCSVLQMGDRVGPVGTGEASSSSAAASHTHWSRMLDRQEVLVRTQVLLLYGLFWGINFL